jgi:hypothetical protein
VKLKTWKDPDLVRLYDSLIPKADTYYLDVAPELNDKQNAERIMYLTALSVIDTELRNRNNTRNVVTIAGQVLLGVLTAALSML